MEPQADNYSDTVSTIPTPPPSYEDAATFVYAFDYLPAIAAPPPTYESVVIAIASRDDPVNERPQREPHFSEIRNISHFFCINPCKTSRFSFDFII